MVALGNCKSSDGWNLDQNRTHNAVNEVLHYCNDANTRLPLPVADRPGGQVNVTALVSPSTGNPVERYIYDAYGKVTIYDGDWSQTRSSSSYDNNILFCGYRYDPETVKLNANTME